MTIALCTSETDGLAEVVRALREWQQDDGPMQLHPGDVGWFWRFGTDATVAAIRTWRRGRRIVAVGLLDGPDLLRLTTAPDVRRDDELTRRLVADLTEPARGVLPDGPVVLEVPADAVLRDALRQIGWRLDAPWTPLRRDLTSPVGDPGLRTRVTGADDVDVRTAVQRASFDNSTFTADRWHAMAAGLPYADARCLVGHDDSGTAVAAATVWSAGPGRPGLIEPLGVHRDHRGHGHGRAITLSAAATLRQLGSSSAVVATPSANVGAVATYASAGFIARAERFDLALDR
jgi:ribosomal protein S18 acetylase RimI-like enzyme